MPRVTDAHRAERREQIITAARAVFAANGFHATSMDDVIRESGLSAGAVYRYFASKDEIILAAATSALGLLRGELHHAMTAPEVSSPRTVLTAMFDTPLLHIPAGAPDISHLAIHGWAESTRNPALRAIFAEAYTAFVTEGSALYTVWRESGTVAPWIDPEMTARLTLSLVMGFIVQRTIGSGTFDPDDYRESAIAMVSGKPA